MQIHISRFTRPYDNPALRPDLPPTVAKRKTLFDDRPIEISELTYIIRQDIASLNTQIASLQSYVRSQKPAQASSSNAGAGKGQVEEHNNNVVMMLQSKLAEMGMGFKDVLELRTQVSLYCDYGDFGVIFEPGSKPALLDYRLVRL